MNERLDNANSTEIKVDIKGDMPEKKQNMQD